MSAPDKVQVSAVWLNALIELRDKAAAFLATACEEQPMMTIDAAWKLKELSDAVTAADEAEGEG